MHISIRLHIIHTYIMHVAGRYCMHSTWPAGTEPLYQEVATLGPTCERAGGARGKSEKNHQRP